MRFSLCIWNPTFGPETWWANPLDTSWQDGIKEELLKGLFQRLSDRKVQCTFNICVNISHLSLSIMCEVQSSVHSGLPRVFPLLLLVQHSYIQILGHTVVSSSYSCVDCLPGSSEHGSAISSSDCRQQGREGKNLPVSEVCWLGAEVGAGAGSAPGAPGQHKAPLQVCSPACRGSAVPSTETLNHIKCDSATFYFILIGSSISVMNLTVFLIP